MRGSQDRLKLVENALQSLIHQSGDEPIPGEAMRGGGPGEAIPSNLS